MRLWRFRVVPHRAEGGMDAIEQAIIVLVNAGFNPVVIESHSHEEPAESAPTWPTQLAS